MHLQHSGCEKIFSALITKPMFVRLFISWVGLPGKFILVLVSHKKAFSLQHWLRPTMTEVMHLQDSGLRKIVSTCFTIPALVNMSNFVAPLRQNLCIFRTVDLIKYFPQISQSCIVGLFSCVRKHVTHLGSMFWKYFLAKLSLCIFNMVDVKKYFPQWSQGPCLWGFLSHELVYRITHLGSWFWYNLQGSGFDKIFSTPITILHF